MNGKWLIALLPIVVGLLAVPATAEDITVTAGVPTYVSVVFNYNTVNFGNVTPGSIDVPAPGTYGGAYNVTVTTNINLNVYAYRTNWSPYEGYLVLKFGMHYNPGDLSPSHTLVTYSQLIGTIAMGSYTHYHGYWLTVLSNAPSGTYSTTVTITYVPA